MRPIVITGVSGFLGGHVWQRLAVRDDVIGLAGSSGVVPFYPGRQRQIDLTEYDSTMDVIRGLNPRCIVHYAALSKVKQCNHEPLLAWRINHAATRQLAKLASELDCRMLFISSDQVFDGKKGMYSELDMPAPLNTYGETKRAAERVVLNLVENSVVVRMNNSFGPAAFLGTSFSEWVLKKEKRGEPITLFHDQYRSFIDCVTATSAVIELIDHDFTGALHLGGASRLNRVEFGNLLLRHCGRETTGILELSQDKVDPEGMMPRDTSYNVSLATEILDTHIPTIEEGLYLAYGPSKAQKV